MTAKEILTKFEQYCDCDEYHYSKIDGEPGNHDPSDGHAEFDIDKALALLQAEIEKCLPEKSKTWTSWIKQADDDIERAAGMSLGYNQALTDVRHRLREFMQNDN